MNAPVRWGLVSTANINRRLIPAIRESAQGELTAVASRSRQSADAYAAKWEIPHAFGSYEAMLASNAVDAVYISLPNHLHAAVSIQAMRHGKHVLCEKPFALSLAEVDEMTAVAAETGMVLAEAFMYRHHPQTKMVGAFVRSGRLGEITLVRGFFSFNMGSRENIRLDPAIGGGAMWDVGVYPMSFAQYVMGRAPETVSAVQFTGPSGVDESFSGLLDYGDGRSAQIYASFRDPWFTQVEIFGTKGRLLINRPFVAVEPPARTVTFFPEDGEPETIPVEEKSLYLGEVEDMHEAILNGRHNYLTLAETRNHVLTTLALYQAARAGRIVSLAEINE